jgi:hypothetical protein
MLAAVIEKGVRSTGSLITMKYRDKDLIPDCPKQEKQIARALGSVGYCAILIIYRARGWPMVKRISDTSDIALNEG